MLALQEFPRKILTRGIGRVNIGELLTRTKYNRNWERCAVILLRWKRQALIVRVFRGTYA